jgi:hypothetical protein
MSLLSSSPFKPFAVRAVLVTVAVLLALGAQAGTVITSVLNVALAMPQRPVNEEKEEHGNNHGKAGAADRRNRDPFAEFVGHVPVPRARLPIPAVAPRSSLPSGVLPDHESDLRYGLGAPLRC